MALATGPRPSSLSRRLRVTAASENQGPTGLNVGRFRPTSRGGCEQMRSTLQSANVKLLSPQELVFAAERGEVKILDIRPADLFKQGHVPGAFNVPFYQPIEGWTPWQVVRRAGYAAFGILNGTEPNPRFLPEVEKAVSKDEQLVVYCSIGGSMEGDSSQRAGRQTRSMIASYQLVSNGFTTISILKGGFSGWLNSGREVVYPEGEVSKQGDDDAAKGTASST